MTVQPPRLLVPIRSIDMPTLDWWIDFCEELKLCENFNAPAYNQGVLSFLTTLIDEKSRREIYKKND